MIALCNEYSDREIMCVTYPTALFAGKKNYKTHLGVCDCF
jgi:hypothetical protein